MRLKNKHIIIFVVCFALVVICTFVFSWKSRCTFRRTFFESFEKAHKELNLGESKVIVLENILKADICLISGGYLDENYIYSHTQGLELNKRIAKRIAKKIPPYDGEYLTLVKSGRVIFVSHLKRYSAISIYDPNTKTVIGQNMLASKVGKRIKFSAKKVGNHQPLLITKIE